MAARQASQSNAMLYAVVTFVALFLISTTFAVIYYVKSEELRTKADDAHNALDSIAKPAENSALARIVGKPTQDQSYLGAMQTVVNDLYTLILGQQPPENMPATAKYNEICMRITALNENVLGPEDVNPAIGPDGVALLNAIEYLKQKLDNERAGNDTLQQTNEGLQSDLDAATAQNAQERENYKAELDRFQQAVDTIRNSFDKLKNEIDNSTEEQLQAFQDKVEAEQAKLRQKQLELQQTEEKLSDTDTMLRDALTKLKAIKPNPEKEVQAYQPDAQIVRVDLQNGIIYLDAGINDRVYRGLTFAIYDRNRPIPEDGEGKAEIEVFQVADRVSAARVVKSDTNNPIVQDDIVANLIWDRNGTNLFVVAGEFDYNNDGQTEPDGSERIVELIERWGGQVTDEITVDVDFLIIGEEPVPMARPTQGDIDSDPMAQQRYETSIKQSQAYAEILEKAVKIGIPIFNQKRFIYLIGYDTLANKNPML